LPAGGVERVLATIGQEVPSALAAVRADRVDALLPVPSDGDPATAEPAARRLVVRLRRVTATALAPFEPDVASLARALRTAELGLAVAEREDRDPFELLSGSWRLLIGVAALDLRAVRATVAGTVGPIAGHPELLDTLRAYLDHGASMNAAAAAVFAHRHTVARRLERIAELTGHDPQAPYGQAELALGLQALSVARAAVD
jgi:DNA-binding PucR family transcriptional regulator